jgi:hypothetical protein
MEALLFGVKMGNCILNYFSDSYSFLIYHYYKLTIVYGCELENIP